MKLSSFLKSKWVFLSLQFGVLLILLFVFDIMAVNKPLTILISVSLTLLVVSSVLLEYLQKNKFYKELYRNLRELRDKHLIAEMMEKPDFADGEILQDILNQATKSMNDKIAGFRHINEEYADYIETWIHEIKLPISTIGLICENNKNELTKEIESDLQRIDGFVEQALYYARSNTLEKDYSIHKIALDILVKSAVKAQSKPLIFAKAALSFDGLGKDIYCDTKWLQFILVQIISNSIKYKNDEFALSFFATENKESIILHVKDNGVGISPKDIDRVFEKGFTGENGRHVTKSTGIGLYLCKKLCDKMNLKIGIVSELDCGTTVSITFPKDSRILLEN